MIKKINIRELIIKKNIILFDTEDGVMMGNIACEVDKESLSLHFKSNKTINALVRYGDGMKNKIPTIFWEKSLNTEE